MLLPPTLYTILSSVRLKQEETVVLMQPTNRPNHIYAVRSMEGNIKNLSKFYFIIPGHPDVSPEKTVVFVDACEYAAESDKIVSHLHAGMSELFIQRVFREFKDTDDICMLVTTSAASHGLDMRNITRLICHGVPTTEIEQRQRCGRASRDASLAFKLEDSENPSNKEKRTESAVCEYVSLKTCRRQWLAARDSDTSPEDAEIDDGEMSDSSTKKKKKKPTNGHPKKASRHKDGHKELRKRLETWREESADDLLICEPREPLTTIKHIVTALSENSEWGELCSPGILAVIDAFDAEIVITKRPLRTQLSADNGTFKERMYSWTLNVNTTAWNTYGLDHTQLLRSQQAATLSISASTSQPLQAAEWINYDPHHPEFEPAAPAASFLRSKVSVSTTGASSSAKHPLPNSSSQPATSAIKRPRPRQKKLDNM
ncbi:hypothetical protein CONPUDRAFT_78463 [Coniophora puteana RWD-64-598 SS2]|uniref:DNA 3'-5' helicase n=1 Tax=Coniophora puteana (strain RWD-64-598) TaxID=741705 RepID=R7SCH0_CONPW|nr:uncharacterized protein CONPUDRAFT_78463 [Coniophora puteana RWD-64-598 SS2]EIW73853.1 hypothetical protein CONPUDRAFT_78463 [Coniophora puteana RWD-64-598 SS2]